MFSLIRVQTSYSVNLESCTWASSLSHRGVSFIPMVTSSPNSPTQTVPLLLFSHAKYSCLETYQIPKFCHTSTRMNLTLKALLFYCPGSYWCLLFLKSYHIYPSVLSSWNSKSGSFCYSSFMYESILPLTSVRVFIHLLVAQGPVT